jgi:hypothetical protein
MSHCELILLLDMRTTTPLIAALSKMFRGAPLILRAARVFVNLMWLQSIVVGCFLADFPIDWPLNEVVSANFSSVEEALHGLPKVTTLLNHHSLSQLILTVIERMRAYD